MALSGPTSSPLLCLLMTQSGHRASTWLDREGGQILPLTGGYEKKAGDGPLPERG